MAAPAPALTCPACLGGSHRRCRGCACSLCARSPKPRKVAAPRREKPPAVRAVKVAAPPRRKPAKRQPPKPRRQPKPKAPKVEVVVPGSLLGQATPAPTGTEPLRLV